MEKCFLYDICNHKDCENAFCLRRHKMNRLYDLSCIPESKRIPIKLSVDSDGTDYQEFIKLADIEKNITNFVDSGTNLYLYSSICGNGKTSWAFKLAGAYLNKIWIYGSLEYSTVLFVSVPKYLQALKDNISEKNGYATFINENVMLADLVIFDEIAAKTGTNFELDRLYDIIDNRINKGKSNIYTSNLIGTDLINALGPKLASRVQNRSTVIEFKGQDKRYLGINQ